MRTLMICLQDTRSSLVSTMFSSVSAVQESKWSLLYGDDDHPLAIWLRIQQWPHDFLLCKSGAQFWSLGATSQRSGKISVPRLKRLSYIKSMLKQAFLCAITQLQYKSHAAKDPYGSSNMTRLRQWEHETRWNPTHHYSIDWQTTHFVGKNRGFPRIFP